MTTLQQAIDQLLERIDLKKLKTSSSSLSECYKKGGSLEAENEQLAYLFVRLPATYAALVRVFSEMPESGTFLDLGAGPGTAWWAIRDYFGCEIKVEAIENQSYFIELGEKLGSKPNWIHTDFCALENYGSADWVLFGYSLGEVEQKNVATVIRKSWKAAKKGVLIVEPGTPRGYKRMLEGRDLLIKLGGYVHAPCPHSNPCPLKDDWCHFSVRLERSFLHKAAKHGTLPFEDEKFSYAIVMKHQMHTFSSRLIGPPKRRSGHVILPLCTSEGIQEITISRKEKEAYKSARKAEWGDQIF